jgi:hypothetical protein
MMTTLSTDIFPDIRKKTWSDLPRKFHEAVRLAFPTYDSPRSIPNDKWEKLVVAYKTWHHIFYSDGLPFYLSPKDFPREKLPEILQHYLNDIALRIAQE